MGADWIRSRFLTHADVPQGKVFALNPDFVYWEEADPPDRVIDGLARYGMKPWNGPDRWFDLFGHLMPPAEPRDLEALCSELGRSTWTSPAPQLPDKEIRRLREGEWD